MNGGRYAGFKFNMYILARFETWYILHANNIRFRSFSGSSYPPNDAHKPFLNSCGVNP